MADTTDLTVTVDPDAIISLIDPDDDQPSGAAVYLASLTTDVSRAGMASHLRTVARFIDPDADPAALPWHRLTVADCAGLRARLVEPDENGKPPAPATTNARLAALRGVLRAEWRIGRIDSDTYHRAVDSLKSVKGSRLPRGRALDVGELQALFGACNDGTPGGSRDACLFSLLYGAGLRRAEACAVQVDDLLKGDDGTMTIRVIGKGNKQRLVHANNGGADAIAEWLRVRGDEPGPLISRVDLAGSVSPELGMTPGAVRARLIKRCEQAGIKPASPHDLRRSFVSGLLDSGADIASVQRLAGHASVDTTARYDRRGEAAARRTAGMLHVPFVAPARSAEQA